MIGYNFSSFKKDVEKYLQNHLKDDFKIEKFVKFIPKFGKHIGAYYECYFYTNINNQFRITYFIDLGKWELCNLIKISELNITQYAWSPCQRVNNLEEIKLRF
jgi:hypothetical protein